MTQAILGVVIGVSRDDKRRSVKIEVTKPEKYDTFSIFSEDLNLDDEVVITVQKAANVPKPI